MLQSVVGVAAGLTSIGGAVYSAVHTLKPPPPGEVIAIVREARTDKPIAGAAVEILTPQDAVVTTLTPTDDGLARQSLQDGLYRLRVSHPQFAPQTQAINVQPGHTSEVRFQLARLEPVAPPAAGGAQAASAPARIVDKGVGATRRLLHRLGF